MADQEENKNDYLGHLPKDLLDRVVAEVQGGTVRTAAPFDLDANGMYVDGWLILTDGKLGHFISRKGKWQGRWLATNTLTDATIVEGLGLHLLRLLADSTTAAEFRFTLRHAKAVARLQRTLERQIKAEPEALEQLAEEAPKADEKKLRCEKCGRLIPAWSEFCPACTSRRKILFRLLDFVKPYKLRTATGIALAVAILAVSLAQPWLTGPMMDRGLGAATGKPDWDFFLHIWLVLAVLIFLAAVGRGLQSRMMAGLGSRVARDVRQTTYKHLHKLSLSFFAKKQTGSLVTRVTSDSDRLWDFIAFTVVEVWMAFLTIAGAAVLMFLKNWKLAIFVLLPLPIMICLTVFFHKKLHRIFGRIWHRWSQMTAVIADALPGVRVIKAFSQEPREVRRFEKNNYRVFNEEMTMINTWTTFGPIMQFCTQAGLLVIWVLGGWWIYQNYLSPQPGGMTIGTLLVFMGYMGMFYRPIHMIAHMDRMLNRAATSAQRIFEILDTPPGIYSKSGANAAKKVRGEIELQNVSFSYDGIRRVLRNVNLKIEPGHMIGLAGPSGGGKTTMVNLICRFYDVMEGRILIDGVDVRDYDIAALRKRIGVVLQEPFLFHGTVAENIAYGDAEATADDIIRSARAANAHDFIVGFPDGYDTLVGERGQALSGGERQRISIARAILNNPAILIFDEATSSVDTETEKLIQEAIDRLIADRTTIAIAHRLSTLRKADRLVILENGAIVEEGTHEQLARKPGGLYAKLLHMQDQAQSIMAVGG